MNHSGPSLRLWLALSFGLSIFVGAREIQAASGTTASNFLKIAVGARPAALGEAYLALSDDSNAFQWNPAGLAQLSLPELSFSHLSYFADINYEYVGFGTPWRGQGLGLGLTWLNVPPFNSTLDPSATPGSASDYALSAAYALSLGPELQLGVTFRSILSNLASTSSLGAALDAGALFRPFGRHLTLAVVAQNLGIQSAYEDNSDPLPVSLRLGLGMHLYNAHGKRWLNAVMDANKSLENRFKFNLGLELWLFDLLALRGGYKLAEAGTDFAAGTDLADFTVGTGFRLRAAQLDYAMVPLGELGITHRVSLSWQFGYTPRAVEKEKLLAATPKFDALAGNQGNGVAFQLDPKKALGDTPLKEWKVEIRDERGRVVKTLQGTGPVPKNLAWDLRAADGSLISRERPYMYTVTLRDWNGNAVSTEGYIAKEIRPKQLMTSAPTYDPGSGGLVFKPKTAMTVGVKEWKLNIRDSEGNLLKTISGTGAIPKNLVWTPSGSTSIGGDLLSGRKIQAIKYDLEFKDNQGRATVVSDQVRFAMGQALEQSYRLPLPLREFKVNSGQEVLVASLPSLLSADTKAAKGAPFVMRVPRAGQVRSWRFEIFDTEGRSVRSFRGIGAPPDNIFWDGLDESGVAVPKSEQATFKLWVLGSEGEQATSDKRVIRNPFTVAATQGKIRKISGIWFRFLESDIQEAVMGKLKELALLLRRDENVQLTIQGHAWDEGGALEELRLSQDRADAVLRYLIEQESLSPRNVSSIGFGSSMPLVNARNREAADKNRRVDVIIVSKSER